MPKLMFRYRAPVIVIVDTETACVQRVYVDDKHFTGPDTMGGVIDLDTGKIASQAITYRAVEIAVTTAAGAEWPAWEFGAP